MAFLAAGAGPGCRHPAPGGEHAGVLQDTSIARHGQAVWSTGRPGVEVVVDLHWWTDDAGRCRLEVSKAALPLMSVQVWPGGWQVVPAQGRTRSGRGAVPRPAGWLQLAAALAGVAPVPPWKWERSGDGTMRLWREGAAERWELVPTP